MALLRAGDIRQCLETFLIVITGIWWVEAKNTVMKDSALQQRIIQPRMSVAVRLRNFLIAQSHLTLQIYSLCTFLEFIFHYFLISV